MDSFEIEALIRSHLIWRSELLALVFSGSRETSESISNPMTCRLGQLLKIAMPEASPLFDEITRVHDLLHADAKNIINLVNSDRRAEAELLITSSTSSFTELSLTLNKLLRKL